MGDASVEQYDIRFSEWLKSNADKIGIAYASELARHFR